MNPSAPVLTELLRFRLDAILLAVLAFAACLWCRAFVRRRGATATFSPMACVLVSGLVLAGAGLAEWAAALARGLPSASSASSVLGTRALALGASAFLIAVLLVSTTLLALMRAEILRHKETERQLHRAKTAADEANRAKSDFLAVMSHEIRTPLNAVMGFATLLAGTKLDENQRGYLSTITGEGTRLSSLINDILDLSKIEEGRLTLERVPFAPAETVHDVLRLLSARALERDVELRFEAQLAGPLLVAGDPHRFQQVLLNLVDNAIKFTQHGSVTLFLTWEPPASGAAQGRLTVRVRDTGIGIPEEKREGLFDMFMQANVSTTRHYGGTGLGLAICQRLVALMGGKITVESTFGEGTEFSFAVPATSVALPADAVPAAAEPEATCGHRPRILVVDDMETNRFLLEIFLSRNGFEPSLAAGGEEAVRLATSQRYDAILMDLQMPGFDGYTATQHIRSAEPPGQRTPIIALTASIAKGTREKCLAAGMDEHLIKPLDLKKFKTLLTNFVSFSATPAPPAASPARSTASS